jgi:uncharacterized protein
MTEETITPAAYSPRQLSPSEERTWSMLAHLSVLVNLVTGFLGPIIALGIYFGFRDRSRYVAYHALQSFLNQLIWWVCGGAIIGFMWGATILLSFVLVGLCLIPIACLFTFMPFISIIQGMIGAVKTSQGKDYRYWWVGNWVRGTLTGE